MAYRMLVIDLDDTLLDDTLEISNENKLAIRYAKDNGVKVVLCSGRADKSVEKYIKMLEFEGEDDYYISYNGAKIDTVNGRNIFKKYIDGYLLNRLIEMGRKKDIDVQLYQEYMIVEKVTERTLAYEKMAGVTGERVKSLDDVEYTTKVLYNFNDIETLEVLENEINDLYSDQLNIFFSKPTFLEVLHKQANKGLAMTFLAKHLGIDLREVIAVGDSFNDISMIEVAGLGIAVNNARDEVKEKADYVTVKSNNQSAIAEIVNRFVK